MTSGRGRVLVPSLAAGLLLTLSLPPFGWWPLAVVGAGLLYWRLAGLRLRARVLAGWTAGLGCFVPALFWAGSFNWYGAVVLMAAEAVSMAVAAALVPPVRGRLAAFAGAFTLCEAVRMAWPFGGLPIGGVFLGQADGPLLAAARTGGPLLMTALVWLGGGALGQLVMSVVEGRRPGRRPIGGRDLGTTEVWAGAALVALGAVLALSAVAPDGGGGRGLTAAAVQGGGQRGLSSQQVDPTTVFTAQLDATAALRSGPRGPRLVVWPEDVIALAQPLARSPETRAMAAVARRLRSTVLAGVTIEAPGGRTFLNEIVAWGPTGRVVAVFEKVHRVPFGEYVPFRGLFSHFASLSGVPADAVAGTGSGLMVTSAGRLGVMVSYEVFFADRGRSSVRAGAELLVVPTNTASYASSQVPTAEVAADRVQAVAEGRDLVQAATTGYSTVVNENGDVALQSVLGHRQVLVAAVTLRRGLTLYAREGDVPVLVLAALALALGWLVGWRRTRTPTGAVRRAAGTSTLDLTGAAVSHTFDVTPGDRRTESPAYSLRPGGTSEAGPPAPAGDPPPLNP